MAMLAVISILAVLASSAPALAGAADDTAPARLRSVAAKQVEARVQSTLRAEIEGGGAAANKLLDKIEKAMWHTFQAMPKNDAGRIQQRAVRYMVHNYFARQHGWLLKGLEPETLGKEDAHMHEVNVLQEKAPALVQALFEARGRDHGFSFSDTVAMIGTIEQLILDESNELLEASYQLNAYSATEGVSEEMLHEILRTFLLLFRSNSPYNVSNVEGHLATKALYEKRGGPLWRASCEFEAEMVTAFKFKYRHEVNLFVERPFTFDMASEIVQEITQAYGKWQHEDCMEMKSHLMQLDALGKSGRVPLRVFHSQPRTGKYSFTETADFLREHGALDESKRHESQVLIANYLSNPSNCIAESSYFSVCCLSECEVLLNSIEADVQAPSTSPEHLIDLVSNLSSSSVDAPRELSRALVTKMHGIAALNGGSVPLHGRLFAQWLHYAFPAECPYPRGHTDTAALTASQWLGEDETEKEKEEEFVGHQGPSLSQWSDEEILPLAEPAKGGFRSYVRIFAFLAAIIVACRLAAAAWETAMTGAPFVGADRLQKSMGSFGMRLPTHTKHV
eukprot:CAMPEP_0178409464 /NCGR_PEP_ID=MMETSP0689_2-20121128/20476_1 /TAXON_ID=160604 /ORGANISM="Amphidinium massartii, Strain CS-259" /LENGTH=563 /DNA_ID=CAMNT_0020030607 /DNA_START=82 /DNA_END=1773 /DNA_ORIENTATION=-